jgi:hypothetical protein
MPDEYGNLTEAEMRYGVAGPTYVPSASPAVHQSFSGTIGGQNVTSYGRPGTTRTADDVRARLAQNSQLAASTGALDPAMFAELFPQADQAAYRRLHEQYRAQTDGQSLGDKVGNALSFEASRIGYMGEALADDPTRLFTGVSPLSTRISNNLFGTDNEAIVGQLGGATERDFQRYENRNGFGSLGAARSFTTSADAIAGMIGGAQAGSALAGAFSPAGGAAGNAASAGASAAGNAGGAAGAGLPEIVVTGTRLGGGLASGLGSAGGGLTTYRGQTNNNYQSSDMPEVVVEGTRVPATSGNGIRNGLLATGGLGIFANGGSGGMGSAGQGNAGQLYENTGINTGGTGGVGSTPSASGGGNMGWNWDQIIDAGGTLLGAYMQGQGGKDAADASAAGALAAVDEQRRQYDQSRTDQMPWLEAGRGALTRLQDPNANFLASPDYAFRREEGTRDIGNSFAARGGALSGNALRGLAEFNSGLAGGEFGNWWNRQAGLAGVGQTSAQNLGTLGANTANNVGNALQNGANARASGIVDQTNAYTGGLADLMSQWNRYRTPNRGG